MRLLFTSVGRRVVYLRQIRGAAERLGIEATLVGTDIDPMAAALFEVDDPVRAPRTTSPGYVDFISSVCVSHGIDVVVPLTDPDAVVLARERARFAAAGVIVATVSPAMADVVDDKWRTIEFFAAHGAATPRSWLTVPDIDPTVELLIKPRRGSAGKGIVPITSAFDLELPKDSMVQERIEGAEMTIDAFCGLDGTLQSIGIRERIEIRSGEVSKARTVCDQDIEDAVVRIVAGLDAVGPITLQCFPSAEGPKFIEINGRPGGGIPLSIHAGSRSDELLLRLHDDHTGSPLRRAAADRYMTRYDDQHFSVGVPGHFDERSP